MLNQEVRELIECAVPHSCPREKEDSNKCVQCETGYSFIACDPILLECGHHVCKECIEKVKKGSYKCKMCSAQLKSNYQPNAACNFIIKSHLQQLSQELKDNLRNTLITFDGKIKIPLFILILF
jgi:hypothetical protein